MKYMYLILMLGLAICQSSMAKTTMSSVEVTIEVAGDDKNVNGDVLTQLELDGETEVERNKSTLIPYEASGMSGVLTVTSYNSYEDVTVSIVNESGVTVYSSTQDMAAMGSVIIAVGDYPTGDYTLWITTSRGTCLSGQFYVGHIVD